MGKNILKIMMLGLLAAILFAAQGESISKEIKRTILRDYSDYKVVKVLKHEGWVKVYEFVMQSRDNNEMIEVAIASDGTVLKTERDLNVANPPKIIKANLPANAKYIEIEQSVVNAMLEPVVLKEKRTMYQVRAIVDGNEYQYIIDESGEVLSSEAVDNTGGF